jgi:RHS repeat-associated protein
VGGARLRQDDTWDWRWDDDGRLIERTTRATGEALRLTWDVRDRLTGIDDVAAGGAVRHTLRFTYDPLDRRVSETLDGVTTWRFHHAGNTVLEKASDGSATVRRLYGQGLDQILAEADAAGVRWLLTDQVGTVRDVVNDAGVVLAHLVYDSFGRELSGVSPSALGFAARPATALGGFIDLRARFYDPASGRFLSADPMPPFSEAFVAGNPLLMRDPTGKSVAIEFACQVVHAIGNVISFASMFLSAIAMLDYVADQVAAAFADALGTQAAPGHGSAAISAALAFIKPLIGTAGKLCKLRALANPKTPPKLGRKLVEWDHTTYHKLPRR